MTPAEAAGLLGLPESTTEAEIHRAYAARIAAVPESDTAAVDTLTRARDSLLAGVRWQPPQSIPGQRSPWAEPATGGTAYPTPDPAYTPIAYPPPPPPPPRRHLSTGAIVGIAVGGTALFLVIVLVAVVAIVGAARLGAASTASRHSAAAPSAAPSTAPSGAPGAQSSGSPTAGDLQSYVIDGVTIQPETDQGWTFVLTSQRDCPGASIVVGFADTVDGDSVDQRTETVSLQAGVPYTYTVPDTASTHQYAGIDDLQCIPT